MRWKDAIKNPPPLYEIVLLAGEVASLPQELGIPPGPHAYLGWRWPAADPKKQNYCMLSRPGGHGNYPAIKNVTRWAQRPAAPSSRK